MIGAMYRWQHRLRLKNSANWKNKSTKRPHHPIGGAAVLCQNNLRLCRGVFCPSASPGFFLRMKRRESGVLLSPDDMPEGAVITEKSVLLVRAPFFEWRQFGFLALKPVQLHFEKGGVPDCAFGSNGGVSLPAQSVCAARPRRRQSADCRSHPDFRQQIHDCYTLRLQSAAAATQHPRR